MIDLPDDDGRVYQSIDELVKHIELERLPYSVTCSGETYYVWSTSPKSASVRVRDHLARRTMRQAEVKLLSRDDVIRAFQAT